MSGWTVMPFDAPGVLQAPIRFSAGTKKLFSIFVPNKDLTGYVAHWLLGIPPHPEQLGLDNAPYAPPAILLKKSTQDNTLSISVSSAGSTLLFTLVRADTLTLAARSYWQQSIAYDPDGNPTPIEAGPLVLGPSLIPLDSV